LGSRHASGSIGPQPASTQVASGTRAATSRSSSTPFFSTKRPTNSSSAPPGFTPAEARNAALRVSSTGWKTAVSTPFGTSGAAARNEMKFAK